MAPDFTVENALCPVTQRHSIAAVTVAYNGVAVLQNHLAALEQQTRKLDEIIVVNNASTDRTMNLLATEYPAVTVLSLPENGGVGGGYAAGLAYAALNRKHDWIWLFDQDSVPDKDALERLLCGLDLLGPNADSIGILAPVCVDSATKLPCPGLLWKRGRIFKIATDSHQPVTLVDMVISSGSLVRRQAVEAVGPPRADFFMDFVDYEYCLRLRRHGFEIAVVRDSHLDHVLGDPSKLKLLGRPMHWTDHPPWRLYYMARNEVFTIWRYYPTWRAKGFALYRLARHALFLLLLGRKKAACLGMMYRGFLDGRSGKLGVRFHQLQMEEALTMEAET